MRADLLDSELADPVDRSAEPDRLGDLRGPGLELPRQVGPRRLVRRDGADHVPAADERRHLLEQRAAAVEDADPGRAVGLVAGPRVEVDVELAQIDRHLRHRLGPVDEHDRAGRVRAPRDLGDRVDRADHVRDVNDRDQLRAAGEQLVERVEVELAVVEHRARRRARPRGPGRGAATGRCSSGAPSRSARRGRRVPRSAGPRCTRRG